MRISQIALIFLGLFITGCKQSIPTDDEMILHFNQHENAFNEIRDIIIQREDGCYYPPYRTDTLYGDDVLSLKGLSCKKRMRLDSLLHMIGCERVFYFGKNWQRKYGNDTVQTTTISIPYFTFGLSIGGTTKEYLYNPSLAKKPYLITSPQTDLNNLYHNTDKDTTFYKKIKGDWYIKLTHEN